MSGNATVSDGRSDRRCSQSSCPTCFCPDGGDGAVAAFDGSVAAPLVDFSVWTDFHMGLIMFGYGCVLLVS